MWNIKLIPECWNKKWLCSTPKIDPAEQDLRPLNLLEMPRKILMGIIVQRIINIWETRGIICDSPYGFRAKRSCDGPTLQVLDAQKEAEQNGTELHKTGLCRGFQFCTCNRLGEVRGPT